MTPVEFSDKEMATFREKQACKTACFGITNCPVLQKTTRKKTMTRKKTKFCLFWPNKTLKIFGRLRNIGILLTDRRIMPY